MPQTELKYTYVESPESLRRLAERTATAGRVAVDTEADSLHHYFEKVCLIQLTMAGENFILDPLAGLDLSGFMDLLAGKDLILHGADYDLRLLAANFDFRPRGEVFDTSIAARLLGYERLGLAALAEELLGVILSKGSQKFDWSRRPLPEEKIVYAANDTRFLDELAARLRRQLRELGREEWAKESCRAQIRQTGRERPEKDPDRVWRIKGLKDLSRQELALVRAIWRWREEAARLADIPPFKVLGNQPLIALALWLHRHPGLDATRGPKLPRTCRGERLKNLLRAIGEARELSPGQWPFPPKRQPPPPSVPGENERYEKLREQVVRKARELGLVPSVLAPQAALRAIARENPDTVEEIMAAAGLTGWQARLLAEGRFSRCGGGQGCL